jgi:aminoglycoside phosphotransferase (APT) family kinase protein
MSETISNQTARTLTAERLGEGPWDCHPFGAGRFSQTFRLKGPAGQYVLRVAPGDDLRQLFYEFRMMRQEPELHRLLLQQTAIPVPDIIHHDFSRRRIDRDWLIMPLLPGEPLINATLSHRANATALRQWGGLVAQAHQLRNPDGQFGYIGPHHPMSPAKSWPAAFREMFSREMQDVAETAIVNRQETRHAVSLLDKHLAVFEHCTESRLLHGDLWTANLLVQPNGQVTALLDWDRACWGDIEWDLAIAEYCGITRPPFWNGYGREVETHRGEASIRRLFYLVYEHFKYVVISVSRRRNDRPGARRYARECLAALDHFRQTGQPHF